MNGSQLTSGPWLPFSIHATGIRGVEEETLPWELFCIVNKLPESSPEGWMETFLLFG